MNEIEQSIDIIKHSIDAIMLGRELLVAEKIMTREEVDMMIAEEGNRLKERYEGRTSNELHIMMLTDILNKLEEREDENEV